MYTGIIDHCGTISHIIPGDNSLRVSIACDFENLIVGESIAVDGICLTVIEPQQGCFQCDVSPETVGLTAAKQWQTGSKVNLERSLSLNDRLGGHFVMGHVDKTLTVSNIKSENDFVAMTFSGLIADELAYVVKKGSACINGISLTINEVFDDGLQVMLIPHTLQRTNLQFLKIGDAVNLEYDYLARIIVNRFEAEKRGTL